MFKVKAVDIVGIPIKEREAESAYAALCLYRGWYHERYVARVIISIALVERKRTIVPGSFADQVTPLQKSERWRVVKRSEMTSYKFEKARAQLYEDWFGVSAEEPEPEPERPAPPPVDKRQLRLFE
ncbi:MAG: hypothetical protein H0V70_25820 [Ktedonobacteraceae bacterium]|nr:hypothetical protein [Ktedonobacteraceae bacterium]